MDNSFAGKSIDVAPIVGSILAGMTNPVSTTLGESAQLANGLENVAGISARLANLPKKEPRVTEVQPKSGINFVLYDESFCVVEENTGYLPVEDHINAIQTLATDKLVMKQSGYLEIFVNNDAQTPVYYDNMTVTRSLGSVIEINAYYPYGKIIPNLSISAFYPEDYNGYKYNAKELQTELELNWLDYGARLYDPMLRLGWITPDPLAEQRYSLSPYSYASNNPINRIDPDGMLDWDLEWLKKLAARAVEHVASKAAEAAVNYVQDLAQGASDYVDQKVDNALTAVSDAATATGDAIASVPSKISDWHHDYEIKALSVDRSNLRKAGDKTPLIDGPYNNLLDNLGAKGRQLDRDFVPVAQGLSLLVPTTGLVNDFNVVFGGKDLFNNPASTFSRGMSFGGICTLGMSNWVYSFGFSLYSAGTTTYKGYTK